MSQQAKEEALQKIKIKISAKKVAEILDSNTVVKLHLGCGTVYKEGWINIDNNSDNNIANLDLNWDLRYPLPFPENSVDFIFNEHFLEHLTAAQGHAALKDFLRVLKPSGIMRIAMPDLTNIIKSYLDPDSLEKSANFRKKFGLDFVRTRAEMLNINFRFWGHQWLYDWEELERRLEDAGAKEIVACKIRESSHKELCNLESRNESTLVAEAKKS